MHEQSETIQAPDGSWINVYGQATPQAGQQLPGTQGYKTVHEAVKAAQERSHSYDTQGKDFWKRVYEIMMTPLPPPKQLELDKLFEFLRNTPNLPEAPNLPTAPAWLEQYAKERGLHPGQQPKPPAQSPLMGLRNMLLNEDPYHPDTRIPNLYRGDLQPDFESGNSLPEVYDRSRPVRL